MENTNETADSQNGEVAADDTLDALDASALKEIVIKERTEKTDLAEKNKQLFVRAKKAEGFEQDDEGNWTRTVKEPSKAEKKLEKKEKQSGELDYGMKAYLRSEGIEPNEFDFITEQMEESGIRDIEKLVANSYFKSQLKERREQKSVENATPSKSRATGDSSKTKVDYWVGKGELPPDTAENVQLRRDVLNKRIDIEKNRNRFSGNSVTYGVAQTQ